MGTMVTDGQQQAQGQQQSGAQGDQQQQQQTSSFALPDAYKSEKVFEGVKSVDDVFKMALEGQKMIGRGLFLPDDKEPDEVKTDKWNKVYTKLGRPEKADQYDTKVQTLLPEGWEWDNNIVSAFQQLSHKAGLSQSQFNTILDFYAQQINQTNIDPAVASREAKKTLVDEWGENGFELHMNEAFAAARIEGGEDFVKWLDEPKPAGYRPGNDPVLSKFLAKIGRDLREDGVIDDSVIQGVRTTGDYESEAKKIIADMNDPYNQPKHAQHRERVNYVNKLWEMSTL